MPQDRMSAPEEAGSPPLPVAGRGASTGIHKRAVVQSDRRPLRARAGGFERENDGHDQSLGSHWKAPSPLSKVARDPLVANPGARLERAGLKVCRRLGGSVAVPSPLARSA